MPIVPKKQLGPPKKCATNNGGLPETKIVIPAESTLNVDTLPIADFTSIRYFMSILNDTNDLTRTLIMSVIRQGSTACNSIYDRIGVGLDIEVNTLVSGSDFSVEIVNNETYDITLCYKKITV